MFELLYVTTTLIRFCLPSPYTKRRTATPRGGSATILLIGKAA